MIQPMNDLVIIKELIKNSTNEGLIVPVNNNDVIKLGEIISISPTKEGVSRNDMIGKKVYYYSHAGQPIKDEGEGIFVLKFEDLIGPKE